MTSSTTRSGRVLGVITARGGSRGLPRKNVLVAGGRPLIAWTISAALAASSIDDLVLATSRPYRSLLWDLDWWGTLFQSRQLGFDMQAQTQSNWCWAATATSVSH